MSTRDDPGRVKRWVDGPPGEGIDGHLGEVFRAVPDVEPLSPAELASVGFRLARERRRGARRLAFHRFPLVLAVLVGGAGAAFAEWAKPGWWHPQGLMVSASHIVNAPSEPHAKAPAKGLGVALALPRADEPHVDDIAPSIALAPSGPELGSERRRPSADLAPAPDRQPETPETAPEATNPNSPIPRQIALESESLQKALAKLRRDHDARSALALLDDYQARFPHGELSVEAAVARVDALLLMGRRRDALALLTRLPLNRVGRKSELQLLRAELSAELDCSQALPDFDAVLAGAVSPGMGERALYGRAACRLRQGDVAGGRGDLQDYLVRYPAGRFVEQVRARLASP